MRVTRSTQDATSMHHAARSAPKTPVAQSSAAPQNNAGRASARCASPPPSPVPSPGHAAPPRALCLERPIVAFDLETTGLDVALDRIVEMSCVQICPDMRRHIWTQRLNPGCPISPAATAVHGITDADVAQMPDFATMAGSVLGAFWGSDITGFHIDKFDVPMLSAEFARVGVSFPEPGTRIIDTGVIFARQERRTLAAALTLYCNRELVGAHSAEADADAAADVLLGQVARYAGMPCDVERREAWCRPALAHAVDPAHKLMWRDGQVVLTFGRHKNASLQTLAAEHPGYLRWICSQSFGPIVDNLCARALAGDFALPPYAAT